jgi:hypothetical protein
MCIDNDFQVLYIQLNAAIASIFLNDIVTYRPLSRQFSLGVLTDRLGKFYLKISAWKRLPWMVVLGRGFPSDLWLAIEDQLSTPYEQAHCSVLIKVQGIRSDWKYGRYDV